MEAKTLILADRSKVHPDLIEEIMASHDGDFLLCDAQAMGSLHPVTFFSDPKGVKGQRWKCVTLMSKVDPELVERIRDAKHMDVLWVDREHLSIFQPLIVLEPSLPRVDSKTKRMKPRTPRRRPRKEEDRDAG